MAHHNFDPKILRHLSGGDDLGLGATGRFPEGQLCVHDEGEIRFAIAADPKNGKVLIDFGKPVHSLGLTTEQAIELAEMLTAKAWAARGITER